MKRPPCSLIENESKCFRHRPILKVSYTGVNSGPTQINNMIGLCPTLGAKCKFGVSVPSQIARWDSNPRPPDQKSGVQPLEPEKHAQLAKLVVTPNQAGPHYYIGQTQAEHIGGFKIIL